MQMLTFPSLKSLDQFKSLSGSAKTFALSSRPSSDAITSGSFANLKLTAGLIAEKLVKEQASVKTDLEMANSKLKKSMDRIHVLEEKLQNVVNKNAKLKVKWKEDEKLWKGLESKFSSTKTLSDQLTETLQHLVCQVQDAEKDKEHFEDKLSSSMKATDCQKQQMDQLSLKLSSVEEIINSREKDLDKLKIEEEERDKFHRDQYCRTANLIDEKDAVIKKFEATVAANRLVTESLNSKVGEVQLELRSKEDEIKLLMITKGNLEKEKSDLQMSNDNFEKKIVTSLQELKKFERFVSLFAAQLVELDKQSLTFMGKLYVLNSHYESCFKLVQLERDLAAKQAQKQFDQLDDKFLCITSEKDALQLANHDLNKKIFELQKAQESVKAQLLEESHLAGQRIRGLESEAEALVSKKIETELLVSKLEKENNSLSESSRSSENKMLDLLLKISSLEMENKENIEKLQEEMQKKEEMNNNQELLTAAERKLSEAKKQHDLMLESKQLELSRHLKEIFQRNDQAINDIRGKYEVEKLEIVNMEKEKADKAVGEMERKCDQRLAECKEEAKQHLMPIPEEHAALAISIQQEHDKKEMILKANHIEQIKCVQFQAENELREKTMQLRNEHEVQMKAFKCQHEDECRKLQEELDIQKSKEDRQRALLQLQWKVMSDKLQEDQEVQSRDPGVGKRRIQHALVGVDNEEKVKDSPFSTVTQTPMSKLLKKAENVNTESTSCIPKHHKKVTRHEHEVETNNGRTITKRRKTRSTVMFEEPRKHKKMNTPKVNTTRSVAKVVKGGANPHPSHIGDLFSEGSLNPYADDPYAFD